MFSSLPDIILNFLALPAKKRRQNQLQYDTLVLLDELRKGQNISIQQLLHVLSQIIIQQQIAIQQYFLHLQNLVSHQNMTNSQVKLNQSRRDLKMTTSKTIKAQIQSDLVMQFNKLNQLSQQNQSNNELNLLDNIVMNAIQTQSKFLQDLDNSIVGETQDNIQEEIQRSDQHKETLVQQEIHDFETLQNENQFRTGDDLDFNMMNDNFRTGDEINLDSPEVNQSLMLSKVSDNTKQQKSPERSTVKKAVQKQKPKQFKLIFDDIQEKNESIQVEGLSLINITMIQQDQYFNQQTVFGNIIAQIEPFAQSETQNSQQLLENMTDQIQYDNIPAQMVSSNQFNVSAIEFETPQNIKDLSGATDIRTLASNKQELIQCFMEVLQLYNSDQVILVQNEKEKTVLVQNCP